MLMVRHVMLRNVVTADPQTSIRAAVKTLHEKFHNGFLTLPMDLCHGDYHYILNNYNVEEDDMNRIGSLANVQSNELKEQWTRNMYPGVINE